jgi:hypothetical protein
MLSAAMTITQYLGNGAISRGRLTITPQLNTQVATAPYLKNATDKEAVIQGIDTMRSALSKVQNLTWIKPTAILYVSLQIGAEVCLRFADPYNPRVKKL